MMMAETQVQGQTQLPPRVVPVYPPSHIFPSRPKVDGYTGPLSLIVTKYVGVLSANTTRARHTPCPELRPYVGDDRSGVLTLEWRYGPTVVIPLDTTDIRPSLLYTNITILTKR